jgi:hypothetical protein
MTPHVKSGGRYPVLRSLAIIYLIGSALAVSGAIVGAIYILMRVRFSMLDRTFMALGTLAAGFFLVVSMLAIAELLKLFIDLEHNTRMAAPGRIGMPASIMPEPARGDGAGTHVNRLDAIDEETAEGALLRGH